MLSGGALVTQPGHTLLGVGAFSDVSAGLGFGGGAGAWCERERTAGQAKNGNEKDEEPKTKCHWNHCHPGYPWKILCCRLPFRESASWIASQNFEGQKNKDRYGKSTLIAMVSETFHRPQLLILLVLK